MSYTKGKWFNDGGRIHAQQGDDIEEIGEIYHQSKSFMANVHLIAAAPDLLAACERDEELANVAISLTPTSDYRNRLTEINILRLAAIAKAKK